MARIGYIRVSTNDQNTDLQREALVCAECEQIFDDKISGTKANRPGLKRALKYLQAGYACGMEARQIRPQRQGSGFTYIRITGAWSSFSKPD